MKTYNGKISIERFSGSESGVSIQLEDESSSTSVVNIVLTPEQFGEALSGLSGVDCIYELSSLKYVGKKREHKIENIPCKNPHEIKDDEVASILSDYEVDGWIARASDFKNHHHFHRGYVEVSFVRWID